MLHSDIEAADEGCVAIANFAILETMILAKRNNINTKDEHTLLANNAEIFTDYPWGRLSFEALCNSMRKSANFVMKFRFLRPLLAWLTKRYLISKSNDLQKGQYFI